MAKVTQTSGRISIPDLAARARGMQSPAFRLQVAQVLAAASGKLIADGFRKSADPYGKPWLPLRSRKGKPLLDTGRLRASFAAEPLPGGAGFRVDATADYARFHQYGTAGKKASIGRRLARAASAASGALGGRRRRGKLKQAGRAARAAFAGGIPQRQMVPMAETGGLPPTWARVFKRETAALVKRAGGIAP